MSKLYIVATPIGNLEDITLRALKIFKEADIIAAEDTRKTGILLNHYKIKKPMTSIHEQSKPEKVKEFIEKIKNEKTAAFVTDAGTPGIADPGGFLLEEALRVGIEVIPIPGSSSITAALSVTGFPDNEFIFLGYFPKKKGRQTLLKSLQEEKRKIIFFESPFRILKTLKDLKEYLGNKDIVVCRELTKKFETIYRGKISDVLPKINSKGEFTVILRGEK